MRQQENSNPDEGCRKIVKREAKKKEKERKERREEGNDAARWRGRTSLRVWHDC